MPTRYQKREQGKFEIREPAPYCSILQNTRIRIITGGIHERHDDMTFHMIDRDDGNIPHGRKRLRKINPDPECWLKTGTIGDGYRINIGLSMVFQKRDEMLQQFRLPLENSGKDRPRQRN